MERLRYWITFKVNTWFVGDVPFLSPVIRIDVKCKPGSVQVFSTISETTIDPIFQYSDQYLPEKDTNFYFTKDDFFCELYQDCCTAMTFAPTIDNSSFTQHPELTLESNATHFWVPIPLHTIKNYTFHIGAKNTEGDVGHSERIFVEVVFNCFFDEIYLSQANLTDAMAEAFTLQEIDNKPRLVMNKNLSDYQYFTFDAGARFEHTGPDRFCFLRDFKLEYVVNNRTQQNVSASSYMPVFSVSQEGMATIVFSTLMSNFNVFISAFNGYVRSNGTETGFMMTVTIYNDFVYLPNPAIFEKQPDPISIDLGT